MLNNPKIISDCGDCHDIVTSQTPTKTPTKTATPTKTPPISQTPLITRTKTPIKTASPTLSIQKHQI